MLQCPLLLNILHIGTSVPEDPVFWVKRDFWRSGGFLLRVAQLLLPLWRRVLLLGKVWMGPGGPRLVQLGQGPGQPQPCSLCALEVTQQVLAARRWHWQPVTSSFCAGNQLDHYLDQRRAEQIESRFFWDSHSCLCLISCVLCPRLPLWKRNSDPLAGACLDAGGRKGRKNGGEVMEEPNRCLRTR